MIIVSIGDYIQLQDVNLFCSLHNQNRIIANRLQNYTVRVSVIREDSVREVIINGQVYACSINAREISLCFKVTKGTEFEDTTDETGFGKFKIIITYINGNTIEEEGVTTIKIKPESVTYSYNRKKFGFLKYSGAVSLELTELKQITVSSPNSERVFHIENGVIVREHIMYDDERKFKSFNIGE